MRFALVAAALLVLDAGLAFTLAPPALEAGTALRLDVPNLARNAELVVEARVLSARAIETPETGGLLQTEHVLEVARTFAGAHEPYRVVRLPGGVREDQSGLLIPGMPWLQEGAEVLLFLSGESRNGMRMPIGLGQGALGIVRLAGGQKRLTRDLGSVELVGSGAGRRRSAADLLDYAAVVAEIEAGLGAGRAGR
jgi:hypothetical protein